MTASKPLTAEIERLISSYGAKAVRDEVARLAKGKAGRPEGRDYWLLKNHIEHDARDWLRGIDPTALRSNTAIANEIAEHHPGQSREATHRRIMRRLQHKRCTWMKVKAMWLSEQEQPFARFFQVAKEVECLADYAEATSRLLDLHRHALELYRARYGEPQSAMTVRQIVEDARRPWPPRASPEFAQWLFSGG